MLKKLSTVAALYGFVVFATSLPAWAATEYDAVKGWIAKKYETAGCHFPDSPNEAVSLNEVQSFDFDRDGKKELIVTASTCWTGTAGPDVHVVLTPKGKNDFTELKIPDPDKAVYESARMEGNRNYRLSVENGLLVETWHDRSGREGSPLIITYRWSGKGFSVDSTKVAP